MQPLIIQISESVDLYIFLRNKLRLNNNSIRWKLQRPVRKLDIISIQPFYSPQKWRKSNFP